MKSLLRTALAVLALAAALSAAGCGDSHGAESPTSPNSGIKGRTMVDAGCPMTRDHSPCPDRPLSAKLVITGGDPERTVTETTRDTDGHFRIPLQPGTYTIHPANLTGTVTPIAQPMSVTVTNGRFTTVDIPLTPASAETRDMEPPRHDCRGGCCGSGAVGQGLSSPPPVPPLANHCA